MDAAEISLCKVKGHSIMAWVCVILHAAVDNIVYGQASNTLAVIFFVLCMHAFSLDVFSIDRWYCTIRSVVWTMH